MRDSMKDQLEKLQANFDGKNVKVSYKANNVRSLAIKDNVEKLKADKYILQRDYESKIKELEKAITNTKYENFQLEAKIGHLTATNIKLENELNNLMNKKITQASKIDKKNSNQIKNSEEYKKLLKENKELNQTLVLQRNQIGEQKSDVDSVCKELARLLKIALSEAEMTNATRELYLRNIKELADGDLSLIQKIIIKMNYSE